MYTSMRVRRVQLGSTLSGVSEVMWNKQAFGFPKGHEAAQLRDGLGFSMAGWRLRLLPTGSRGVCC